MKIVINVYYGGFGLSTQGLCRYLDIKGVKWELGANNQVTVDNKPFYDFRINRHSSALVEAVEGLGELAWGDCARLKVVDIPDDVQWEICDYDGREWVAEIHRTWE